MGQYGTMIQEISKMPFAYAHGLLDDLDAQRFARTTAPGGTPINANHPAWQVGHLAIYPSLVAGFCDLSIDVTSNTDAEMKLFEKGADCCDDADGSIYPAMSAINSKFFDGYGKLVSAAAAASDEHLMMAHTGSEPMREKFSTRASLIGFMVVGHVMMHMGQISYWRRCEGMGSAM